MPINMVLKKVSENYISGIVCIQRGMSFLLIIRGVGARGKSFQLLFDVCLSHGWINFGHIISNRRSKVA